jgi:hypothetical protein
MKDLVIFKDKLYKKINKKIIEHGGYAYEKVSRIRLNGNSGADAWDLFEGSAEAPSDVRELT